MSSPFGATGTLGTNVVGSTLGLLMQLHWLALEPLVEDMSGIQIRSRLLFGMWLTALKTRGDGAVLRLVLIEWLTCWLEF